MPSSVVLVYSISQMAAQRGKEVAKSWAREMGFKGLVARADSKTVYFASICFNMCFMTLLVSLCVDVLTDTSGLFRGDGQRRRANSH